MTDTPKAPRVKASHVGAPAIFALEQACQDINAAFGGYGCYLVGSALERPDWRDVDVRIIMSDDEFAVLFPDAGRHWEHDPRWLLLTISISERLSKVTGLPIDFQFQPRTHANERHKGQRNALGMLFVKQEVTMGQVSSQLRRVVGGYSHWCPGCEGMHAIAVEAPLHNGAKWSFDGNLTTPTFSPSVNIRWGKFVDPTHVDEDPGESGVCHYFLTAGQLQFCGDSTHALAGKTVPLPPLPAHVTDEAT